MNPEPSLPSLDSMTSSAAEWNEPNMLHNSSSAGVPPTIPSMDYDTFAGYDTTLQQPAYIHEAFSPHSSHAQLQQHHHHHDYHHNSRALSHTPEPVAASNYPYPHSVSPAPRMKMESHHSGYRSPPEASQYPSPHSQHALPVTMSGYSSAASSSSNYMTEPPSHPWSSRPEFPPLDAADPYRSASSSYLEPPPEMRPTSLSSRAAAAAASSSHRAPRTKQRRLTTRDEANFQCDVKGCGKLFSRSYNFKAHLETHDEKREYPFPCQVEGCTKKFVRKTDLSRHHQSVHMKERNHKCDFCSRTFARKDTLRR